MQRIHGDPMSYRQHLRPKCLRRTHAWFRVVSTRTLSATRRLSPKYAQDSGWDDLGSVAHDHPSFQVSTSLAPRPVSALKNGLGSYSKERFKPDEIFDAATYPHVDAEGTWDPTEHGRGGRVLRSLH